MLFRSVIRPLNVGHVSYKVVSMPHTSWQQVPPDEQSRDATGAMANRCSARPPRLKFPEAFSEVGIRPKVNSRSEWDGCALERLTVPFLIRRLFIDFRAAAYVARGTPVSTSVRPPRVVEPSVDERCSGPFFNCAHKALNSAIRIRFIGR